MFWFVLLSWLFMGYLGCILTRKSIAMSEENWDCSQEYLCRFFILLGGITLVLGLVAYGATWLEKFDWENEYRETKHSWFGK